MANDIMNDIKGIQGFHKNLGSYSGTRQIASRTPSKKGSMLSGMVKAARRFTTKYKRK